MTKIELEKKIGELEEKVKALEAKQIFEIRSIVVQYVPYYQPQPWPYYQMTSVQSQPQLGGLL